MTLIVNEYLQRCIAFSSNARGSRASARQVMDCFDLTSLRGNETRDDILDVCDMAKQNSLASVCIYPNYVEPAAKFLKNSHVVVATVINFPTGLTRTLTGEVATPQSTAEDVRAAVKAGARQIDLVLPYGDFLRSNALAGQSFFRAATCFTFLKAARDACPADVTFKVILETAAFEEEDVLRKACRLAIDRGADCLKTSTGKHANGGATMESAAILLDEAQRAGRPVGCKITGGIKTNDDCARYMTLARSLRGWDAVRPDLFRIGASGLLDNLILSLGSHQIQPEPAPSY